MNGAKLKSAFASSDGVIVDTTPPISVNRLQLAKNIINNPNFVKGSSNNLTGWNESVGALISTTCSLGQSCACLKNSAISQTLKVTEGHKYRVSVKLTSGKTGDENQMRNAFVKISTLHHSMKILPFTTSTMSHTEHYYITSQSNDVTLSIGTEDRQLDVCFLEVKVQELLAGQRNEITNTDHPHLGHKSPVLYHFTISGHWLSLSFTWDFEDPESPIVDYLVAVGTVKGWSSIPK